MTNQLLFTTLIVCGLAASAFAIMGDNNFRGRRPHYFERGDGITTSANDECEKPRLYINGVCSMKRCSDNHIVEVFCTEHSNLRRQRRTPPIPRPNLICQHRKGSLIKGCWTLDCPAGDIATSLTPAVYVHCATGDVVQQHPPAGTYSQGTVYTAADGTCYQLDDGFWGPYAEQMPIEGNYHEVTC